MGSISSPTTAVSDPAFAVDVVETEALTKRFGEATNESIARVASGAG